MAQDTDRVIDRLAMSGTTQFAERAARKFPREAVIALGAYIHAHSFVPALSVRGDFRCLMNGELFEFPLEIIAPETWRQQAPQVRCDAPWMRVVGDWHVYENGCLCWTPSEKWRDTVEIAESMLPQADAIDLLIDWLANSCGHLVYCHKLADEVGIREWPTSWDQYRHDRVGQLEYEHEGEKFRRNLQAQLRSHPTAAKTARNICVTNA